jgi:RimJ/RimL family protein N-acetyltransferase
MRLRRVRMSDVDTYVRMRCDPVMMAELGGPLPRDGIEEKVRRDVEESDADRAWIMMVELEDGVVAGSVVLWSHQEQAEPFSEIGWMVLPEHQGRGIATSATRTLLERARDERRWGIVHAFPGATNAPSNGICRSLGFTYVGPEQILFTDRPLLTNHWKIDPATQIAPV